MLSANSAAFVHNLALIQSEDELMIFHQIYS